MYARPVAKEGDSEEAQLAALFPGSGGEGVGDEEEGSRGRARFTGGKGKGARGGDEDDDDDDPPDEWDGAQVVVLKEGRHLTEEEVRGVKRGEKEREEEAQCEYEMSRRGGVR